MKTTEKIKEEVGLMGTDELNEAAKNLCKEARFLHNPAIDTGDAIALADMFSKTYGYSLKIEKYDTDVWFVTAVSYVTDQPLKSITFVDGLSKAICRCVIAVIRYYQEKEEENLLRKLPEGTEFIGVTKDNRFWRGTYHEGNEDNLMTQLFGDRILTINPISYTDIKSFKTFREFADFITRPDERWIPASRPPDHTYYVVAVEFNPTMGIFQLESLRYAIARYVDGKWIIDSTDGIKPFTVTHYVDCLRRIVIMPDENQAGPGPDDKP